MAFIRNKTPPQFADLKNILAQSKSTDNALNQTLQILIDRLDQLESARVEVINNINNSVNTITSIVNFLTNNTATYITTAPEEVALPNSVQLLPGTGITFDDTVPNRRTINGVPAGNNYELDYEGDYTPIVYNNGDIVVGPDGITYVCVKDGTTTPPEQWPGSPPGSGPLHHTTHEPGGGDALVNAAWLNLENIFTGSKQQIQAVNPMLTFVDMNQAAESRVFRIFNGFQAFEFAALNDAQTAIQARPLTLTRVGDALIGRNIFEKGRTIPLGHWQNVPFSAANFSAAGGGTWTIGPEAILFNRYTVIGNTMHWSIYISWFSGGNALAGTITGLNLTIPGGFISGNQGAVTPGYTVEGGVSSNQFYASGSGSIVILNKISGGNITSGTTFGMITTFTLEVQ